MISNPSSNSGVISLQTFDKCTNDIIDLTPDKSITVVESNVKRSYAAFVNTSTTSDVTLVLGDPTKKGAGAGIVLKPKGGSFEITQINLFVGKVSAISSSNARLSFVECSNS